MDKIIALKFQEALKAQEITVDGEDYIAKNPPAEIFKNKLSEEERLTGFAQALYYLAKIDLYNAGEICDGIEFDCSQIPLWKRRAND
jgi:hypothetical protein